MTTAMTNEVRDDLFTHIHKALRVGLFEITARAGRTDWSDPGEVTALVVRWQPFVALLRAHTAHEDEFILRLLDSSDPVAAEPAADQHRDLDDLLDDLAGRFDAIVDCPSPAAGLQLYRDLARFIAAYLPHLHDEETRVMDRIWACCTDEQIAATRAGFMAATAPEIQATTLEYLLPALDGPTRTHLLAGLATAPPPVVAMVNAIAERVLTPEQLAALSR